MRHASRVSASRRELNSHEAASPQDVATVEAPGQSSTKAPQERPNPLGKVGGARPAWRPAKQEDSELPAENLATRRARSNPSPPRPGFRHHLGHTLPSG